MDVVAIVVAIVVVVVVVSAFVAAKQKRTIDFFEGNNFDHASILFFN